MSIKIKICGLKTSKEIEIAYQSGATWYGLVFYDKSSRNITLEEARHLVMNSPPKIKPVAVLVDENLERIEQISKIGITTIQLHGHEDLKLCYFLKEKYSFEIIKAIKIASSKDIEQANNYINCVDWILYDQKDKYMAGGSGKSFDWTMLRNKKLAYKWILSGGLDYKNIISALKITNARAVDVSSGVEDGSGKKSNYLITNFCKEIENYSRIQKC